MEAIELARKVVDALSEKQASDILMLDASKVCTFTDYLVICSGDTDRQIGAICDEINRVAGSEGANLHHREGTIDSGWVLLDFGGVIVHIFAPSEREFYELDRLWASAAPVVRIL